MTQGFYEWSTTRLVSWLQIGCCHLRISKPIYDNHTTRKNQFYPSCVGVKLIFSSCMIIMYGFWDSQMTTPGLKSTHRSCGWLLVKSLDRSLLKTPYECFMWYLTDVLLNTEGENWTKSTHIYDTFFTKVTPENVKVTRGFYFWSKFN